MPKAPPKTPQDIPRPLVLTLSTPLLNLLFARAKERGISLNDLIVEVLFNSMNAKT